MRAAWYQARVGLRARWRGAVALGLAIGLVAALVLAAMAGARRADTALARLLESNGASDVGLAPEAFLFHPTLEASAIERLPMVEAAGEAIYTGLNFPTVDIDERELLVPFAAADADMHRTIDRPKVIAGRLSDPARALEITISEALADRRGLRPGGRLRAQPMTPEELATAQSGEMDGPYAGPFAGPMLSLHVVGVVRTPSDLSLSTDEAGSGFVGGSEQLYLTPAFHRRYTSEQFDATGVSVRLRGGERDIPAFLSELERLAGEPVEELFLSGPGIRKAQRAIHVEALALYLFATLVGLALVAVFGQTLSRDVLFESENGSALRALGMTRRQRAAAGVLRMAIIVAGAMFVAVMLASAASGRFPIGLGRLAEPVEGFDFHPAVLLGGAGITALLLLGVVATTAWRASHDARIASATAAAGGGGSSWVVRTLSRIGAPLSAVNGARLAVTPGRGRSAIPIASTLAGLVTAMVALSASAVFGASLQRLVTTPRLQGWSWDASSRADDDAAFETVRALATQVAGDPDIREVSVTTGLTPLRLRRIGGRAGTTDDVIALGIDPVRGRVFPPVLAGRMPAAADEVVLPPRLARRLGVGVGDRVQDGRPGGTAVFRVVGEAVFPDTILASADASGDGVLLSAAGAHALQEDAPTGGGILARFSPDADRHAVEARLEETVGTIVDFRLASDVRNLNRARWTPIALGAVLAVIGLATLTHLLVTAVRRRRRDLAILKSFGVSRRGVSATVAWQATTLVTISLVLSVPVGVVAGRVLWRVVAGDLGVVPDPATPVLAIALAALGAVLVGNVIAAIPGRAAAHVSAADALRAE